MSDSETGPESHSVAGERPHAITYFVNGEPETTIERELTVKEILENAGFTPAADYTLSSENPPRDYANLSDRVKLHERERFNALFKGPTPTS